MSLVIIDNNNSSVQYNTPGGWLETGNVPQFDGMTHASGTQGDTAMLVFEGASAQSFGSTLPKHGISNLGTLIRVYGTVAPSSGQSRLNFSIDDTEVGFYQAPEGPAVNNSLFWTSPSLEYTLHKLVITVDQDTALSQQANPLNRTFFLNYFIYKTTSTAGKPGVIDDNDLSVTYSPKWDLDKGYPLEKSSTRGTKSEIRRRQTLPPYVMLTYPSP
ncbi:hypothetical protein B0H14DRAFT_3639900 [Mycena olivaceomarginata]|nr:hypothetical protein B0H14DRAFT_3639900 [Mycena olivaceomarginata]